VRENGGQYQHAAVWVGWAFALLSDGKRAHEVYDLLLPVRRTATREGAAFYRGEPYALAGDISDHEGRSGSSGWTWYTGSAAWTWRLGVERILGLRLEDGRLRVDPCLPPGWDGFEATVRGPAGTLRIRVENGAHGDEAAEAGAGRASGGGTLLEFPADGSTRDVTVRAPARRSTAASPTSG